jgi:anti-anti-sigma regulatory factor
MVIARPRRRHHPVAVPGALLTGIVGRPRAKEVRVAEPATVDDLRPGDHACLTFSDADERLDVIAAFVRDGLDGGHKVLCHTDALTAQELAAELTDRGLPIRESVRTGQLEVSPVGAVFVPDGAFAPGRVIDALRAHIDQAQRAGYAGLRITADMGWALRPVAGVEHLVEYESRLSELLAESRATAVCQYDRQGFDTVTLASVTAAHGSAVAAVTYHHDAVLRICRQYLPPGVRIAGELDYRGLDALSRALSEAVRIEGDLFLNLAQLRFLDAAAAGLILQTAPSLGGNRMTVVCQPLVGKVLRLLGADEIANVRLVIRDVG